MNIRRMWLGEKARIGSLPGAARLASLCAVALVVGGVVKGTTSGSVEAISQTVLKPLPAPSANMAKAVVGRRLFFDTRLSSDGTVRLRGYPTCGF
jgi:cytochrome c peroxidase